MSPRRRPRCPLTPDIRRAIGGELDDELLAHLGECAACQEALDEDLARDGLLDRLETTRRGEAMRSVDLAASELPRFARYRMLREIGRGGQGTVYEAIQESTGRSVAIKVLRTRIWDDARMRTRIEREVAILGKLDHGNVCPVIDFVRESDRAGVVMPFLEGEPLWRRLHVAAECYRHTRDPQLAWSRIVDRPDRGAVPSSRFARLGGLHSVVHLMEDIIEAVEAVHRAGVVHRDLKPANVIVCGDGHPVVLDFGLALDLSEETPRLTQEGEMRGTPTSMAPEQINGNLGEIDARTDVYALGVILYELLAFEAPFEGTLPAVLQRILAGSVKRLRQLNPSVPKDLEAVCMKAMAGERSRRYASAAEMGADLARVRRLEPTVAKPVSTMTRLMLRVRRHPALAATGAAAAVLAIGLVATRLLWWESVGFAQEAYGEYFGLIRGDLSPGELVALPELLGDDFEPFLQEEPARMLALVHRGIDTHHRGAAGNEALRLRAPRATVRREGLVFALEATEPMTGASLRVRDLETDEVIWRETLPELESAPFQVEAPHDLGLVAGRRYEWSVSARVSGASGLRPSASAVFRVASPDAPGRTAASLDPSEAVRAANSLLKFELAAEALELIERVDLDDGDRRGRAAADLVRVRAFLMLGREEQARVTARPWHDPSP